MGVYRGSNFCLILPGVWVIIVVTKAIVVSIILAVNC